MRSSNEIRKHHSRFVAEFDPVKRAFTFFHETKPQMAMGMTEDDHGIIWSVSYPNSGVVSFNPGTRDFKDYGHMYAQNWPQYQRYVAADAAGWIYFGLGNTASQIVAFDPANGKAIPMLAETDRQTARSAEEQHSPCAFSSIPPSSPAVHASRREDCHHGWNSRL